MLYVVLLLAALVVGKAWVWHALYQHRHAHKTIARAADQHGWDDDRKVVELRSMKRRRGLMAKFRRWLRGLRP